MVQKLAVIGVLFSILLLAGYFAFSVQDRTANNPTNEQAKKDVIASVVLQDAAGNQVDLNTYGDSVLVVNTWATWSPATRTELPLLQTVAKSYPEEVRFVALNRKEDIRFAENFLATLGEFKNIDFVYDDSDAYFAKVEGYAMPETAVFGKDGQLVLQVHGPVTETQLREGINKALKEY